MNTDHASATEKCTDEAVLIEAAKIDPAAFEPLYQHYMARIYGKVLMSAVMEDKISGGSAGITDNFTTLQQANAIVVALKTDVLPVELRKL